MKDEIKLCSMCPRECGADRIHQNGGFCRVPDMPVVSRAALHFWEEDCISGENGSGTVFFAGCNLQCVYCQNKEIAEGGYGKRITIDRLAAIFLELQEKGAENINLVTPSHYALQILKALKRAKKEGLSIPVVYNSSAYEKAEILKELKGYVDVYLPDFKYMDPLLGKRYSKAINYSEVAKEAIKEMVHQAGEPVFDERGMMRRGVIVRHMVLPGHTKDSKAVIQYLHQTYKDRIYISLLSQYTPMKGLEEYPEINRRVSEREYEKVVDYAIELGVVNGFIQDRSVAKESFIPKFDNEGV